MACLEFNPVDAAGQALVRALTGTSPFLDWLLRFLLTVDLVKLGPPVGLALFAWMAQRRDETEAARQRRVTWSILGVLLAIGLGRAMQDGLPPRERPRQVLPEGSFAPIEGIPTLAEWSSMPSDHAVLAAALAVAAFSYSWKLGFASALWGVVVVAFPRLYFGYHWLSDLLAGAAFGALVCWLMTRLGGGRLPRWYGRLERRAPGLAVLALFVIGYEFVSLFATTRRVLAAVRDVLHALA